MKSMAWPIENSIMDQITAIFEAGVFRPTGPVELPEGTEVTVSLPVKSNRPVSREEAVRILERIRALPTEPGLEFSNRDHDKILYGKRDC